MEKMKPLKIEKEPFRVIIHIPDYRITGTIHLPPGGRVSDFMNCNVAENPFIPLTEISVYAMKGNELLFTAEFLSINRNTISFLALRQEKSAP